jgi:NCS1 family nucleobase:cation symporter-1
MATEPLTVPAPERPVESYRGIEVRSIDWVPDSERHGKLWHQLPLWFLGNFQYFSIPIGFVGPSLGLSLGWSIVAGAAGILIGTVFMAFHATQGPTLGLPQMIQSRAQFGYRGVVVALFATLFTYLAFNVADQVLMSEGLNGTFGWNRDVIAVVTAVAAAIIAIWGHDWVHRVFRVLLVLLLPLMTIITIGVLTGHAGSNPSDAQYGFNWTAFMAQLSAAAAYNITYAPYVSDYSRYLPRDTPRGKIIASVFAGASTPAIWLIALGAWFWIRLGVTDGLVGLQTSGNNIFDHLGGLTAFVSACALAATMGMNAYGGMLTTLTGIDAFKKITPTRNKRIVTILVLTVVWFVVAKSISVSSVGAVYAALTLMLYLLVPWTAINLIDFFFVRKGHYAITELFKPNGLYGVWNRRGLIAYAIGFAVELPFMVVLNLTTFESYYTGFAAKNWLNSVDVSWIIGLIVTSIAYLILSRDIDPAKEAPVIEASERELAARQTA